MNSKLTDFLIRLAAHDASAANSLLAEAIPDLLQRYAYLQVRGDAFILSEPHSDHDDGPVGVIDMVPAILGLSDAGRARYRELAGEDAPGLG